MVCHFLQCMHAMPRLPSRTRRERRKKTIAAYQTSNRLMRLNRSEAVKNCTSLELPEKFPCGRLYHIIPETCISTVRKADKGRFGIMYTLYHYYVIALLVDDHWSYHTQILSLVVAPLQHAPFDC